MLVTIIGAQAYHPKTAHNRDQYLKIVSNMRIHTTEGLAVDTDNLKVDPTFVSYAVRNHFVQPIVTPHAGALQ